MHWSIERDHPLRRLFQGLVDQVFTCELGLCNPRLTDYLGDLLADFVHVDRIHRLHGVDGEVIREVSRMEADARLGETADDCIRRRLINRYIGDYTLFWAGVYPEALRPRRAVVDRLREYVLQGKRSYGTASELSEPQTPPPAELLRELSAEFEACVHGLQRVREGWRQLGGSAPLA